MYKGTLASVGPWEALITFQQFIILADKDGVVDMTPDAISRETTIPREIIDKGIETLEMPDPESRTPDNEGRRIMRLSDNRTWGWKITNYDYYRKLKSEEERREYHRQYWHKRKTQHPSTNSNQAEAEALSNKAEEESAAFDTSDCPKDMDAAAEHRRFVLWYGEKSKAPTAVRWSRWISDAKQSGRYMRAPVKREPIPEPPPPPEVSEEFRKKSLKDDLHERIRANRPR